jgi:predicted glycogen debranching enzyme
MPDVSELAPHAAPDLEEILTRSELFRRMPWTPTDAPDWEPLVEREWLVTNGRGGYSSGTVLGLPTRRYHGLLVAALPAPLGRTLLLGPVQERVTLSDGREILLGGREYLEGIEVHGARWLAEFRLEWGLPVWTYDFGGTVLERRLLLPYLQNTVVIRYRLLEGRAPVDVGLQPMLHFRSHDDAVDRAYAGDYHIEQNDDGIEISHEHFDACLRIRLGDRVGFDERPEVVPHIRYQIEAARGYAAVGQVWSPGEASFRIGPDDTACIVASAEAWDAVPQPDFDALRDAEIRRRARLLALADPAARAGVAAELVLAADQFVITSPRLADTARAHAEGEEARSIIAGYHWFTDWGRDTMISLEGLTLTTGRRREAGQILRTFGRHMRDGLIPNLFPEGGNEGLYHTADATLWFFHAVHRFCEVTGDETILDELLPLLRQSVEAHVRGTRFGIGIDPGDALLRQGAEGYQLTWMDAKVDDWVVTPRRGKAVEINALWYNALRLMERWEQHHGDPGDAARHGELADRVRASFNRRFWNDERQHLLDIVDGDNGDDAACRPNQIFAIALPHPVLDERRWKPVLDTVESKLLTPVGLRSLAPDEPDYEPVYFGDLRARDAAYHQGTVWGWLIGPFVDAYLRVHPDDRAAARSLLHGLALHLDDFCIGTLAEIFDGEEPHRPRGCVAQAWSIAEVLRCWVKTAPVD